MGTDASRFDRVEAHPDFATAPAQPVLPADQTIGLGHMVGPAFQTALWGIVLVFVIASLISTGASLMTSLVVILILGAIVVRRIKKIRGLVALRDAPIQKITAVIVKERAHVTGHDRRSSTAYYATLQTRDGRRVEYRITGALVGRLVVDDIGVAYVRDTIINFGVTTIQTRTLVEFIRFDVA